MDNIVIISICYGVIQFGLANETKPRFTKKLIVDQIKHGKSSYLFSLFREQFKKSIKLNPGEVNIVFIEDILFPMSEKKIFSEIFLHKLRCKSLIYLPNILAYSMYSKTQKGLFVELGWKNIVCVPVFDYRIIDTQLVLSGRGAKFLAHGSNESDKKYKVSEYFIGEKEMNNNIDYNELPIPVLLQECLLRLPIDLRNVMKDGIYIVGFYSTEIGSYQNILKSLFLNCKFNFIADIWYGSQMFYHFLEDMIESKRCILKTDNRDTSNHVPDWFNSKFQNRDFLFSG